MEFFDWNLLGTCAGAATAVGIITEVTKDIPFIRKIPTMVWSYAIALVVLMAAMFFGQGFSLEGVGLALLNAGVVSLASNGGYEAVQRAKSIACEKSSEVE